MLSRLKLLPDGIKYWLWVATSDQVCALFLAPTRSSAELEQLLGHDFNGILSSDCFSAYSPQSAAAKQKCLAHLERDLEALKTSRFEGNRQLQELALAGFVARSPGSSGLSRREVKFRATPAAAPDT